MRDYRIVQALLPGVGKKDFPSLLYTLFPESTSNPTAPMSVYYLQQLDASKQLFDQIGANNFQKILQLESDLVPILAKMEHAGVCIQADVLQEIGNTLILEMQQREAEIFSVAGMRFNINSPKQVQSLLFETLQIPPLRKNKTGYSVDTEVLEEIAKTHDIARLILEYRQLAKLESVYVTGLLKTVDADGKIHTTYDALGTTTGRMSSNKPNLQNIPTGDGYADSIKSCFVASPGNVLLVVDYSQIELRILAFLSRDRQLLDAFEQGIDIHLRTAQFLFGNDRTITEQERRIAKSVNFGVIYGITGFGLAKTLGVAPWEATKYINIFYETYPQVRAYYDTLLEEARQTGYVETFFGRRRYIIGINDSNKMVRSMKEREAMNMPIQGTAADIIKIAMRDIDTAIRVQQLQGAMILQVHDELIFDIPKAEQEVFQILVQDCMEQVLYHHAPESPAMHLPVSLGVGANWREAK